jgi:hypothetical protein
MKKIFKASVLAFALAFMLNACGSDDSIKPVLYEMFDNYDYANFPAGTPWSSYNRTSGTWTDANWSITNNDSNHGAYLSVPSSGIQNSAFINTNYNKTNVDCSESARLSINSLDNNSVQLGVILRASDTSHAHYAFVYLVENSGSPLVYGPTVEIQKVDAAGTTITKLGIAPIAGLTTPFDPTAVHTYRFSVSGTTTLTFTASIDGIQQLPAVTNPDGTSIPPPITPIIDSGSVYTSGNPGFFVENANTASVSRFSMWEP